MVQIDTKQWIQKAILVHGHKYNYDKVNYVKSDINMILFITNLWELIVSKNIYFQILNLTV